MIKRSLIGIILVVLIIILGIIGYYTISITERNVPSEQEMQIFNVTVNGISSRSNILNSDVNIAGDRLSTTMDISTPNVVYLFFVVWYESLRTNIQEYGDINILVTPPSTVGDYGEISGRGASGIRRYQSVALSLPTIINETEFEIHAYSLEHAGQIINESYMDHNGTGVWEIDLEFTNDAFIYRNIELNVDITVLTFSVSKKED